MKRIYNDIPVDSVLFTVPGNTMVTVKDFSYQEYQRHSFTLQQPNPVYIWQGYGKESHRLPYRYRYAKVYHIEGDGTGGIVIWTVTEFEKY